MSSNYLVVKLSIKKKASVRDVALHAWFDIII